MAEGRPQRKRKPPAWQTKQDFVYERDDEGEEAVGGPGADDDETKDPDFEDTSPPPALPLVVKRPAAKKSKKEATAAWSVDDSEEDDSEAKQGVEWQYGTRLNWEAMVPELQLILERRWQDYQKDPDSSASQFTVISGRHDRLFDLSKLEQLNTSTNRRRKIRRFHNTSRTVRPSSC